jgi:hypothetical protein
MGLHSVNRFRYQWIIQSPKSRLFAFTFRAIPKNIQRKRKDTVYCVPLHFTRIITVLGVEAYAGWEASQWQWALSFATSQPSAVGFSAAITACSKLGRQDVSMSQNFMQLPAAVAEQPATPRAV